MMEAATAERALPWAYGWIEYAVTAVDLLAAFVIVVGMTVGTLGFLAHWRPRVAVPEFLENYREQVGRSLLLALELLVAADILETILLGPNKDDIVVLAVLILLRTVLSWTLELEIDHRWPWQAPLPGPPSETAEK